MLGTLELDDAAQKAAGNWQNFRSFVWWRDRELADADQWAIIYTHHRDSGLLNQSNAAFIAKALKPLTEGDDPDVVMESHHHWAVGHKRVWSGFEFDLYGFSLEPGIEFRDVGVMSQTTEYADAPLLGITGNYFGQAFVLRIHLEPVAGSETREIVDTLRNEVRPFEGQS